MLRDLSLQECELLILRNRIGRIAMRDDDGTYIIPISYAFQDGVIYGHLAPGRKLAALRHWPKVAFQVDEIRNPATWKSVLARGEWVQIDDRDEAFLARTLLLKAFDGSLMSLTAGHGHRTTLADAVMFKIVITEISGRAENL